MPDSTKKPARKKPQKPRADFPLTAHPNGQWSKKIRGRVHYFGVWEDPHAAEGRYLDERDYLKAGRTPPRYRDTPTVDELINKFLAYKRDELRAEEIVEATYGDYREICKKLADNLGRNTNVEDLTPKHFFTLRNALREKNGAVRMRNLITRIRTVLAWGHRQRDPQLCPHDPKDLLADCKIPPMKKVRKERREKGKKFVNLADLRRMLALAEPTLRASILLGINCGMGNNDISQLTFDDIDLDAGWLDSVRPKTEEKRRAKLWPETVAAIKRSIERRPEPASGELANRVFLRPNGREVKWFGNDWLGREFKTTRTLAEVDDATFYWLRHTFNTIAKNETKDPDAVEVVMGHVAGDEVANSYDEGTYDSRLEAVADAVHRWLYTADDKEA